MIPVGTLCVVVGNPVHVRLLDNCPKPIPSRLCEVTRVPGETPLTVCEVTFPDGTKSDVTGWEWLRPITPPPVNVKRDTTEPVTA